MLVVVAAIAIGIATAGGGSDDATVSTSASSRAPTADVRGVPAPIAANLRDGNKVIDASVEQRLAALKGVPVVVNQWASWCPNCRAEFGFFQSQSQRYRKKVAFLGLDSQDSKSDAEDFLRQFPVSYPSIYDHDASQAQSLGAGQSWPTTLFVNRAGEVVYARQGGYVTEQQLEADIRRYALGS